MQSVTIYNLTRQRTVVARAEVACSWLQRLVGLLLCSRLSHEQGLWLTECCSIHTVGMRFPIDVLFLDAEQRVVALHPAVRPFRLCGCRAAQSVLELSAGAIERSATEVGDRLCHGPPPRESGCPTEV